MGRIKSLEGLVTVDQVVKLRRPTDFLILEALQLYGRNVAPNIAEIIGKSRKNINTRLPVLDDYGLVDKVGPSKNSGLYEITKKGVVVLQLRESYESSDDFDALVERRLEQADDIQPGVATVRGARRTSEE